ncbi:hypothetical protein J31TS4_26360 [Paenibacillus sp. J31TS4]|uniref:alpha/beta hydrolase n=1 Tax=Paenibacillus sp. J31TS4 TaxID=2807195 RepID=UPI001B01E77B|nr:hypothetical protein [Paenibacillus sp. J31TS4]GIP39356.1 hypothetical protein J31TS4_26360 [Paenibacillus sp. J31TS4]
MAIGRRTVDLTDERRPDPFARDGSARRIPLSIYYPAEVRKPEACAEGIGSLHEPCAGQALAWFRQAGADEACLCERQIGVYPDAPPAAAPAGMDASPMNRTDTGIEAHGPTRLPVVLYAPGFGLGRDMYWFQVEALVRSGMIVAAAGSVYESVFTVLADGGFVKQKEELGRLESLDLPAWLALLATRVADLYCVLNALEAENGPDGLLAGRADLGRIGAVGHSLGGAAVYRLASGDSRLRTGVLHDPSLHLFDRTVPPAAAPLLLLRQEASSLKRLEAAGMNPELARAYIAGQRYAAAAQTELVRVGGTHHMSFSDIPLLHGEAGAEAAQAAIAGLTAAYLRERLAGHAGAYSAALHRPFAARYRRVDGEGNEE